jgi:hypothetical protein
MGPGEAGRVWVVGGGLLVAVGNGVRVGVDGEVGVESAMGVQVAVSTAASSVGAADDGGGSVAPISSVGAVPTTVTLTIATGLAWPAVLYATAITV